MAELYGGPEGDLDGSRIRNMRVISDDKTLIHNMALAPEPIGTIEVIDGQFYRVMDNTQVTIVTQAPFTPERECSICGKPMMEGYYCCDEYYCSRECLDKSFEGTGETWEEHYEKGGGDEGDCFWTEWED